MHRAAERPFGRNRQLAAAWDATSGTTRVIASAEALNATKQTPLLDSEVVPVTDGTDAYFASNRLDGETWVPSVISCGLDNTGSITVIGNGAYPAVSDKHVLWARLDESDATLCTSLMSWDGSQSKEVFSIGAGDTWGISGVWACGDIHAVSFSSKDSAQGSYAGIWRGDFESLACWIATDSPRAIGSLNQSWFAWGAGSESDNTEMFTLNLGSREVTYLGDAPGYSRPTIAQECDVVMVPVANGMKAVSFRVGTLG